MDNTFKELADTYEAVIKELGNVRKHAEEVHGTAQTARAIGTGINLTSTFIGVGGIFLAPFTGGLSLTVTVGTLGGVVVGTATNIITDLAEQSSMKESVEKVEKEMEKIKAIVEELKTHMEVLEKQMQKYIEQGHSAEAALAMSLGTVLSAVGPKAAGMFAQYAVDSYLLFHISQSTVDILCKLGVKSDALLQFGERLANMSKDAIAAGASGIINVAAKSLAVVGAVYQLYQVFQLASHWNDTPPTVESINNLLDKLRAELEQVRALLGQMEAFKRMALKAHALAMIIAVMWRAKTKNKNKSKKQDKKPPPSQKPKPPTQDDGEKKSGGDQSGQTQGNSQDPDRDRDREESEEEEEESESEVDPFDEFYELTGVRFNFPPNTAYGNANTRRIRQLVRTAQNFLEATQNPILLRRIGTLANAEFQRLGQPTNVVGFGSIFETFVALFGVRIHFSQEVAEMVGRVPQPGSPPAALDCGPVELSLTEDEIQEVINMCPGESPSLVSIRQAVDVIRESSDWHKDVNRFYFSVFDFALSKRRNQTRESPEDTNAKYVVQEYVRKWSTFRNSLTRSRMLMGTVGETISVDQVCQMRSGLEFFASDFGEVPLFLGEYSIPFEDRDWTNSKKFGEYIKPFMTSELLKSFDTTLDHFCEQYQLSELIPSDIPDSHWWWKRAAKPKTSE
ncbi:unnamed protein product [Cyprideis torosa]|uniref:Uncharacterized protein n=1 Tax=Cyprideis torosa TaxID=163714 RepID=A0A7R8ZJS5_9CRUS|nr:unnamed protein product [Cyprideis torosa]CAG0889130.1 unnamed protein product [Cyprideis torosa]